MSTTATTEPAQPEPLPVDVLLQWGQEHTDPDVQDQAARAGALLGALRNRHTTDEELRYVTTAADQLEKRLAELRAREAELAPAKTSARKRKPVDYPAATVRVWAAQEGIECAPTGRVAKAVVDAWRQAGSPKP
ncbi:hypothetical protein [Streptomyces sp. 3212.3]|uniref:hypothetical protein n=1 Tax=Streptomyces sp. 3212.3 TaxID=1938846 RepID=UPI002B405755|nr:hypothetical protein [Streptomyces sp. 3212.3]